MSWADDVCLLASTLAGPRKEAEPHTYTMSLTVGSLSVGWPELQGAGCPNSRIPVRGHALDEVVVLRLILVVVLAGLVLVLKLVEVLVEVLQAQD